MQKSMIFLFFFILCNLLSAPSATSSPRILIPQAMTTPEQEQWYDQKIIHFYGIGALFELNLSIDYFFNNTFAKTENEIFPILNRVGTAYNLTMSGCYLSDIFDKTNLLATNATHIQFEARDGYRTFPLPLRLLEIYSDMAIIVTYEDSEPIPVYPEEGPLKSVVKLEVIQNDPEMQAIFQQNCAPGEDFVHNSKYLVKNLCAITILNHAPYNITTTDTTNSSTTGINQIDGFQMEYIVSLSSISILFCILIIIKKGSVEYGKPPT